MISNAASSSGWKYCSRNSFNEKDFPSASDFFRAASMRGKKSLLLSCLSENTGFWGCCGAAVSAGMFYSIATGTTPLSGKSWGEANALTARCLQALAALGGPRCCKRNSFTAIRVAAEFTREHLGVAIDLPDRVLCRYFPENQQCIRRACPYYPGGGEGA